jgi:LDH2 family malate/lactate/ureidoglycolate dehydrogenase
MKDFCDILRSTPAADPDKPVLVPGDIEIAKMERHRRDGVVLEAGLQEKLEALAARG